MSKKILYAALGDIDIDSDTEVDTSIYSDAYVQQAINYIQNAVFSQIEWDYSEITKEEVQKFFLQWLLDGYSCLFLNQTLNNEDITKIVKINGEWNVILKLKKYSNIDDYEYINVAIVGDESYINPKDYDEIFSNSYLIYRKRLLEPDKLITLMNRKNKMIELLDKAIEKGIIPIIIGYVNDLDEEYQKEILKFLRSYKNGSSVVVNSELIEKIDIIEVKTDIQQIFTEIDRINKEICFILGVSDNLFSAKGTELATSRTIENAISMNINSYIQMIVGVLQEYEEKNNKNLNIQILSGGDDNDTNQEE